MIYYIHNKEIHKQDTRKGEREMTKFERAAKRAELLGMCARTIINEDEWTNLRTNDAGETYIPDENQEMHELYMKVLSDLEKLL